MPSLKVVDLHPANLDNQPSLQDDINYLSPHQLNQKYKQEFNSHRNMRQRCSPNNKQYQHCECHPSFDTFAKFLSVMGKAPSPSHTLDRLNPHLKVYSPANCRWADKSTQAINKTNTITIATPNGDMYLPELAKQQGVTTNCIYKRYKAGWSDEDLFQGYRTTAKTKAIGFVGVKSDWVKLLHNTKHRLYMETSYLTHRRHYGKGLRYESRAEYLYRYLHEAMFCVPYPRESKSTWSLHEYVVENLDYRNRVLPEYEEADDLLDFYSHLFKYAAYHWTKGGVNEFRHPRYNKQNHTFRI